MLLHFPKRKRAESECDGWPVSMASKSVPCRSVFMACCLTLYKHCGRIMMYNKNINSLLIDGCTFYTFSNAGALMESKIERQAV